MFSTKLICSAYSDDVLDVRTCQNWFARFKAGNFDLKDKEHTGRPVEVDDDFLQELELRTKQTVTDNS